MSDDDADDDYTLELNEAELDVCVTALQVAGIIIARATPRKPRIAAAANQLAGIAQLLDMLYRPSYAAMRIAAAEDELIAVAKGADPAQAVERALEIIDVGIAERPRGVARAGLDTPTPGAIRAPTWSG